jgi:DNA-binding response OmpR family regulator
MTSAAMSNAIILKDVSILIVEDAWHVAKAMKRMLGTVGMNVLGPAATSAEARLLLAHQRPFLALVDINLRGELAWDLIGDLREQGVEVVVMSGYPLASDPRGKSIVCLQKPCEATELIEALSAVVSKRIDPLAGQVFD